MTPQVSQRLARLVPRAQNTPLSQVPAEGGCLGSKASGRRPPGGEGRVPCPCPGSPTQPAPAGMWSSHSLAAPGATTSKGGDRGSPLPGLPRLPGDDNFPATGSSWPGFLAALPPRLPAIATPSRRAGGCTDNRLRALGSPGAGSGWASTGRSLCTRQLTGMAGVAAASGSSVPGTGARSPPPPAASPQWLGLGLGGSPESGLSRTPSPFFFVSTSSGTSCRLSRPTMAARLAWPGHSQLGVGVRERAAHAGQGCCPPGRPPCPAAGALSGCRRRPRSLEAPPSAPPRGPTQRGDRQEAVHQGPLHSRRAPPRVSAPRSSRDAPSAPPYRQPCLPLTRLPASVQPPTLSLRCAGILALSLGPREVLISLDLAAQSQSRVPACRGLGGGGGRGTSKQLEIINT